MNEQDMEQMLSVPVDDEEWSYGWIDDEPPDEPPFFDDDDVIEDSEEGTMEHITAVESEDHEEIKKWIAEHPGETIKYLAAHLDQMADAYGQGQAARYARLLASDALKLHWMILGVDEAIGNLQEIPGW